MQYLLNTLDGREIHCSACGIPKDEYGKHVKEFTFYNGPRPCALYAMFIDLVDSFNDQPFTMKRLDARAPEYLMEYLHDIPDRAGLLKELIEIQLELGVVRGDVSGILCTRGE